LISGEVLYTTIALSFLLVCFVYWGLYALSGRNMGLFLLCASPILLSRSLRDYMTSGLETPLVMFSVVAFVAAMVWAEKHRSFWLGLATSLCLLTRHDLLVIIAPFLIFEFLFVGWRQGRVFRFVVGFALGLFPFLLWTLFSSVYFGLPVPNTARAKVVGGDTIKQALLYLEYMRHFDPMACLLLVVSLFVQFFSRFKYRFAYLASVVLFVVYIMSVGADYMIGRFFVGPVVLSVVLSVCAVRFVGFGKGGVAFLAQGRYALLIVAVVMLLGFRVNNESRYWDYRPVFVSGMVDERHVYYGQTDLETMSQIGVVGFFRDNAMYLRDPNGLYMACNIGMAVYFADRGVKVIDPLALSDFFLAGLNPLPGSRVGHFERPVPVQYVMSLQQGRNAFTNPVVAAYYQDTLLITRSPELFSVERMGAIARVLTGVYADVLREASVRPEMVGEYVEVPPTEKTSVACAGAGARVIRFK